MISLYLFIASFFAGLLILGLLRRVSAPGAGGVPHSAGIGIFLALTLSVVGYWLLWGGTFSFQLSWILLCASCMLIAGLIDDARNLALVPKLALQVVIIGFFLLHAKRIQIWCLPAWANILISFVWVIGITNAFNHLDIADGLLGGIAFFAAGAFLAVSWYSGQPMLLALFVSLCAPLAAFLLFNYPPAKMIMGNSGSHALGFLFAAVSMYADYATRDNFYALAFPLLVLAFPVIDTVFVSIVRIRRGVLPFRKSDDHMYQKVRLCLGDDTRALCVFYLANIFWCASAVMLVWGKFVLLGIALLAALACTFRVVSQARRCV
jgi:UDP-GlcNAc:undecaprenyl-phosphate GlcNAc-1-phosphate transferase